MVDPIVKRRVALAAALAPFLTLLAQGCRDSEHPAELEPLLGTLQTPLIAKSTSGTIYRLTKGTFAISGPRAAVLAAEEHVSQDFIETLLPPGEYTILLRQGWQLRRQEPTGDTIVTDAVFASANPSGFSIAAGTRTTAAFSFEVSGPDGSFIVNLEVREGHRDGGSPDTSSLDATASVDAGTLDSDSPPTDGAASTDPDACSADCPSALNDAGALDATALSADSGNAHDGSTLGDGGFPDAQSSSAGTFRLCGTVTGLKATDPAVAITLSGQTSSKTTTNAIGQYSFDSLPKGHYTIIPSLSSHEFAPPSISVTVSDMGFLGIDFAATTATEPSQPSSLRALWGDSRDDVWAVGDAGAIRHWDGATWSDVPSGTSVTLHGVWGSSPGDIWAVGGDKGGVILHWDGATWSNAFCGAEPPLYSAWGTGANDVWAVGYGILHWNGHAWSNSSRSSSNVLRAVAGSGPSDVWAMGRGGTVAHWDGTTWSSEALWTDLNDPSNPNSYALNQSSFYGLWSNGPDDAFAVFTRIQTRLGVCCDAIGDVFRFNGGIWATTNNFVGQWPGPLNGVWGAGPDDVWAVGEQLGRPLGAAYHWNGTAWSSVNVPTGRLNSIWGSGSDSVWAVGDAGAITYWNGVAWSSAWDILPQSLESVCGTASGDLWAAGGSTLYSWNNSPTWSAWSRTWDGISFYDMWCAAPNDVWAIGRQTNSDVGAENPGVVVRCNRTSCDFKILEGSTGPLRSIWGLSSEDVWITDGSDFFHWNGTDWLAMPSGVQPSTIMDLWGSAPTDIWAVTSTGTILHWNGSAWSSFASGMVGGLHRVWGTGPTNVWVVGDIVAHWDGDRWSSVFPDFGPLLMFGVWASGPNDVWLVGFLGIFHWDGVNWSQVFDTKLEPGAVLFDVWGSGPNNVVAVGRNKSGSAIKWDGVGWSPVPLNVASVRRTGSR